MGDLPKTIQSAWKNAIVSVLIESGYAEGLSQKDLLLEFSNTKRMISFDNLPSVFEAQSNQKTEKRSLESFLAQKYPITLYPEPEGYTVEIKDLPGCLSQGDTAEEALQMIEEARILWIESAYENGDPIPPPSVS